jgi:hypothetical protein
MPDRTMVISWGAVVRGREERALDNFNDVVGMFGRMQQEGRVERFDVTLLAPNQGMNGFMQLQGSAEQIEAVREDEEFRRLIVAAALIVDDLAITEGYVNDGVASQLALFRDAVAKVPQAA